MLNRVRVNFARAPRRLDLKKVLVFWFVSKKTILLGNGEGILLNVRC